MTRGKGLELLINEECTQRNIPTRFTVSTSPRATIVKAVREAEPILQSKSFDYIYLMAGVNNLTSKSSNGKITPTFNEIPNLVDVLKGISTEFQVIRGFSQKIPADLLSYNKIHS